MVYDTSLVLYQIRKRQWLPALAVLPTVVVGEVRSFSLKANWGAEKAAHMEALLTRYPTVEITEALAHVYARVDAYSQGRLWGQRLPPGMSARNMGKNGFVDCRRGPLSGNAAAHG